MSKCMHVCIVGFSSLIVTWVLVIFVVCEIVPTSIAFCALGDF